jgi:hypothetical protein
MYLCQVGWTRVDDCVGSLGSLRCGVFAESRSVVLRASMLVRSWSLAIIASVFHMCIKVLDGEGLVIVRIVLHLCVPVAHKGAKCLMDAVYCRELSIIEFPEVGSVVFRF